MTNGRALMYELSTAFVSRESMYTPQSGKKKTEAYGLLYVSEKWFYNNTVPWGLI